MVHCATSQQGHVTNSCNCKIMPSILFDICCVTVTSDCQLIPASDSSPWKLIVVEMPLWQCQPFIMFMQIPAERLLFIMIISYSLKKLHPLVEEAGLEQPCMSGRSFQKDMSNLRSFKSVMYICQTFIFNCVLIELHICHDTSLHKKLNGTWSACDAGRTWEYAAGKLVWYVSMCDLNQ